MGIPQMRVKIADGGSVPQTTVRAVADGERAAAIWRVAESGEQAQLTVKVAGEGERADRLVRLVGYAASSFPSVSLLDDFNRADAANLGANWTTIYAGDGVLAPALVGNAAAVADTASFAGAAWNVADFGPDVAVSVEIKTAPTGSWVIDLYGRLAHHESGTYAVSTNDTGQINLYAYPGALSETITLAAPLTARDRLGLVIRGTALEAWVYQSDAWSRVIQATDATYSAAGWVAFDVLDDGGTLAIDNFSAVSL